jgi:O-antigen/teichoic acid export membrane protein
MPRQASRGQILRSSAIVGAANALNILMGIARTKVLAALLGPAGVGLVGVFSSIVSTASILAGLGLSGSAVRQLAASAGDPVHLARVRRALWLATIALGLAGSALVWAFRAPLAALTLGNQAHAGAIGWLSLGVFLSVVAGSQTALLRGLRRVAEMAQATVIGAAAGSLAGIACVLAFGERGLVAFVVTPPAMAVLVAGYFARRLPQSLPIRPGLGELAVEWRGLLGLGVAFMLTNLMSSAAHLWVRSILVHGHGLDAAGQFQAAWAISTQYIGFLLTAMLADFYPRLVQANDVPAEANELVNDQIEMGLLLAGPPILLMIGFGPLLIQALYSAEFVGGSTEILRWQLAGDIFKLASWPIGLVLVARGARGMFLFTQSLWVVLYLGLIHALLARVGIEITGVSFLAAFAVGLAANVLIVGRLTGFRMSRRNAVALAALLASAGSIMALARLSEPAALSVALLLAAGAALASIRELLRLLPSEGRAHRVLSLLPRWLGGRPNA